MKIVFPASDYIERNKQTALKLYGDRLDEKRNIKGTMFYFDYAWRLRVRSDANDER
jgi:hypothetical protein